MVIVQIEGGLGNQMFQYALCQSFTSRGIKVKLDISKFDAGFLHNGYELEKVFNLQENYCSKTERAFVKSLSKIRHVLFKYPYKEKKDWQWVYHPEVNKIQFGFLKGYWQSEKYFAAFAHNVRERFTFPPIKDERNMAAKHAIIDSTAVSLHIRRGDYLKQDISCSVNTRYYSDAIALMNKKLSNPFYFVFSDDIEWAKENIKERQVQFIDWNNGANSFIDMQLMSLCKHHIIANSSFSWWGAWLNNDPSKLVIAPGKWMPGMKDYNDVLPGSWIPITTTF